MSFVEKTVKIEKDVQDLGKLLVDLVDTIYNKKDYNQIVADIIATVDGIATVPASWAEDKACVIGSFAYETSKIINVFEKKA